VSSTERERGEEKPGSIHLDPYCNVDGNVPTVVPNLMALSPPVGDLVHTESVTVLPCEKAASDEAAFSRMQVN